MESNKFGYSIADYSVSQTTLDQVNNADLLINIKCINFKIKKKRYLLILLNRNEKETVMMTMKTMT